MLEPLLYFSGTVVVTVMAAILICRYRVARQKRISYGTLVASSLVANVCVLLGRGIYEEGLHVFTREAWSGGKGGLGGVGIVLGVITILCLLPAMGVAVYYQKRSMRHE